MKRTVDRTTVIDLGSVRDFLLEAFRLVANLEEEVPPAMQREPVAREDVDAISRNLTEVRHLINEAAEHLSDVTLDVKAEVSS